jgi:hypothetical protein
MYVHIYIHTYRRGATRAASTASEGGGGAGRQMMAPVITKGPALLTP